jgi:superfamily II DNA or RNA helicase
MALVGTGIGAPGIETVFVPGHPARTGRLALWSSTRTPDTFTDTLSMVLPAGGSVRQRTVPVRYVDLRDAIDELVALPTGIGSASTQGWAAAARGALHLIARGRLLPGIDLDGTDAWRVGPLDAIDLTERNALADALPTVGHATAIEGSAPRRISSARWLVARFWDAIADAYGRTAAASAAAGHDAYASWAGTEVLDRSSAGAGRFSGRAALPAWLAATGSSAEATTAIALRLEDADASPSGANAGHHDEDTASFRAVLEVASVVDPSLVLDAAELWRAPDAVAARFGSGVEGEVLLALRRGARIWPPVARLLDQARPDRLDLDGEEVAELLGPVADRLAGDGIEVRWPANVLASVDLAPVVASPTVGADRESGLDLSAVCELRWDASIDGEALSEGELAQLVAAKRGVVRLRGRWVRADPERLARLETRRQIRAGDALAAALGGELLVDGETVDATIEGPLADLGARLADHDGRSRWEPPDTLHAELRPYQRDGAAWLSEMAALGLGGVLADDMGLGKTVQFLALHLTHAPERPTLVICPVSVLGNWAREAARFAPGVPVVRYHGVERSLDDLPAGALVLTTYGVARRETATLAAQSWGLVAADEAQAIKNPLSRTARALRTLPADARFALTGTPVENRLVDLWSLLDWTTPGLLGPLDRFRRGVAVPVERDQDAEAAAALAQLVRPFLLRRRKADPDIAPDLPPKTETDRIVPLTTEQATLYAATVEEVMAQVETAEGMSRRGLVLKLLTGLKQICNHPAQYLKQPGPLTGRSGKLDAVTELVDTIDSEGEAVLVFTQYVTMAKLLHQHLSAGGRPVGLLHGGVSANKRQDVVDRFQAGELPVFVISVKAGGTGLNLTRATHVIHYDRWWNPAVEDQASDRAWRIGQDRPVQVHRMVCEGTVEDKIAALLTAKRSIADAVVTSGEGWVSELGDADLRLLVALGADDEYGVDG